MIGCEIIHKEVVDSTNNYLTNLVHDGKISHGVVILADHQTNGRGQRNTIWQSIKSKNLLFSYFTTYKELQISEQFLITQYVSSAIHSFLKFKGVETSIKWPNDILFGNQKICGVLIENQIQGQLIKGSIIGIGLNINQEEFEDTSATSLKLITGKDYIISIILNELLNHLNFFFNQLIQSKKVEIKFGLLKKSSYLCTRNNESENKLKIITKKLDLLK